MQFVCVFIDFVDPIMQAACLNFVLDGGYKSDDPYKGFWLVAVFFIVEIMQNMGWNHCHTYNEKMRNRSTNNLKQLIFEKQMRMSEATNNYTQGEIISLMNDDVNRFNWI